MSPNKSVLGSLVPKKRRGKVRDSACSVSPVLSNGCGAWVFCGRERDWLTAPLSVLSGASSALLGLLPPLTEQGLRTSATPSSGFFVGSVLVRALLTLPRLSEWYCGLRLTDAP